MIDKREKLANNRRTCCSQARNWECRHAVNVIMNTKRNPQHISNSYNGGTIGRDSPSALLEVLAEVASQTLHSEKKHNNSMLTLQFKPKTASMKRKDCFTVSQLMSMPVSHLIKQFAIFTSDELKRQYSYSCALVPGCQQKYTSFASEEKARVCIKNHLEEHLEHLKADKEAYDTFTAKSINHKNLKINLQNKKGRIQQIKKPQETLNKENKDVILEKSTNYLCKILLNDIKENDKHKCFQKTENKQNRLYNIVIFYARFKTRNTYKRHLKTRHNKILTTFGEVLHPPEEDFHKVRNNRKKKDCAPETIDIDNIASNTIVNFETNDETQVITNTIEEYVLKENIDDNRNWELNDVIHIDKFENFEVCSESQLNKTDGIETEIAIDCNMENSNVNMECVNNIKDGLLQLKNSFYDNIEVTNDEENHVIYQHSIEDQDKIYNCSNEIRYEYSEINSKNETLKEEENKGETKHKINTEFLEEQDGNNLQEESTHDYHKICTSDTQDKNTTYTHLKTAPTETTSSNENNQKYDDIHIIITQNNHITNEKSIVNSFGTENKKHPENIFCAQVIYANINIPQTFNEIHEKIISQNQNNILQESEYVSQSIATNLEDILNVSSKNSFEINQQNYQYLYICNEQLSKLIAQNKYIAIPLHQIKLCRDYRLQAKVDNYRSMYIINEDIRTIIKQSEKQNAILVLSNDSFKNSIFQVDKNSIIVTALDR
ncbi:LOW QUALITY PROTEIN: variant-silencing SET domain-containing protein-like [Pogonomyrmex barbatus]|uniref:LOW QUALITY PROTEIN: variant-silencing SET domain-containing protein-like n=1 Tax=Pogonomyrmex barbatus TaxID=144034 RepID=A0A6I9WLL2_9HYME|nr:LOW QUALITY PROTEIN: variant-silencing SET domain-containing protein-like [Pogonomyrmex barbatus]